MRLLLFAFTLASIAVSHAATEAPTSGGKPNIVFVLSDDHSYPYLGCYGHSEMKTPSLDQFAADADN